MSERAKTSPRHGTSRFGTNAFVFSFVGLLVVACAVVLLSDWHGSRPSDQLLANASADTALREWLVRWQKTYKPGTELTDNDRAALRAILDQTPLSSQSLVVVGRDLRIASHDNVATAIVFSAAIRRADEELHQLAPQDARAKPILLAINETRSVMWGVVDDGHREFLPAVSTLVNDLARWIPRGDPDLDDARVRAGIAAAGCLYLEGDMNHAVSVVDAIDPSGMTKPQRVRLGWIRGLIMFQVGRFAEAEQELTFASLNTKDYKHTSDARALLVLTSLRLGKVDDAQKQFDQYLQLHHPSVLGEQARITLAAAKEHSGSEGFKNEASPQSLNSVQEGIAEP